MPDTDQLVNPAAAATVHDTRSPQDAPPEAELPEPLSEIERIFSPGVVIKLESERNKDVRLVLQKMDTRQFLRMLAILTSSVGPALVRELMGAQNKTEQETRDWSVRLLTLLIMAFPESEQKTFEFLGSMFLPDGYKDVPFSQLTEEELTRNKKLMDAFNAILWNPPLEDTLVMVEAIVRSEARDIVGLGNRIARMFRFAVASGQLAGNASQSNGSAARA